MATMKEIAALAGVSAATVSYVLSGKKNVSAETRDRVIEAISLTNYKPNTVAKSLRMNKTHIIGVIVEDICGLPVPEIVDGINQMLEASGYQVLLNNLRLLEQLYNRYDLLNRYTNVINRGIQLLEDARVDGIIYVAMHDRRIDAVHQPAKIPLVFAYAESGSAGNVSVTYDNEHSARDLTRLLIGQNHRRVAIICGHPKSPASRQRLSGYREAMREAGLPVPQEYIRWGDWNYESGVTEADALLSLAVPPTAVFAMNDPMAAGCYTAVQRRGLRIPADMSVVGFDNRELASCLYPTLTTIALPNKQIGYTAAEHIVRRLSGQTDIPASTALPCQIIRRESTAAIRE